VKLTTCHYYFGSSWWLFMALCKFVLRRACSSRFCFQLAARNRAAEKT